MSKITEIDKESLSKITEARTKAIELAQAAKEVMKDARIGELEFKNVINEVYIKNGLDKSCNIDINTGIITWPEDKPLEDEAVSE